jgi:DNA-binding beta-propeller fold protein YncE
LAVKGNYIYVTESLNHRIQVLKINPDGSLTAKLTFGEEGGKLGEFWSPGALAIKGNLLYVSDTANERIQILEVRY